MQARRRKCSHLLATGSAKWAANNRAARGGDQLIERHVTFEVVPGRESAFEDLFRTRYSKAMGRQPGFVSVGLLRESEQPSRYQMVIRFESLETAAAWRDSPEHRELSPVLKALYSGSSVVVYEVIA